MKKIFISFGFGLALTALSLINVVHANNAPDNPAIQIGQIGQYEDNISGMCDRAVPAYNYIVQGFPLAILSTRRHDTSSSCKDYYIVDLLPLGFLAVWAFASLASLTGMLLIGRLTDR